MLYLGHILGELCHDAVTIFEKDSSKNYLLASSVLEILLDSPFCLTRRGQWYIRLCIDYSHLQKDQMDIRDVLTRAMNDKHIKVHRYFLPTSFISICSETIVLFIIHRWGIE